MPQKSELRGSDSKLKKTNTRSPIKSTTGICPDKSQPILNARKSDKEEIVALKCAEVRWFYMKPEENKWTPFNGYDSLSLEITHRCSNKIPLDSYAKENIEQFFISKKVYLLGNLFEWDPTNNPEQITSIYWKTDSMKVLRGTWFYSDGFQPLEKELANDIERHHLKELPNKTVSKSSEINDSDISKRPALTTLKVNENEEVKWNSASDIVLFSNTRTNILLRLVTRARGVYPLKRGYLYEANIDDGRLEFSDLILVIHGIGQKNNEHLIYKNTTQIREAVEILMSKNYPDEKRRPMILPIEWRSSLILDDGLTDTITLPRLLGVRNTLNSVIMDIMYYQSPLYRQEIINGVADLLNSTYKKFIQSHPKFNGPISIFAHSLGSVIAYDILTNWSPLLFYDEIITQAIEQRRDSTSDKELRQMYTNYHESRQKLTQSENQLKDILTNQETELMFKTKFLFCVGSPLAVFIVMRGHQNTFVPAKSQCERIFNVFHPYDPVAYRLEPLFHSNYKYIRPIRILSSNDSNRSYTDVPFELHKSYLKKMSKDDKTKKEQKDDRLDKLQKNSETEEDNEEDSDTGDSSLTDDGLQQSKDPISLKQEANDPSTANNPTGTGHWWRFGGSNVGTDAKKEDKEEAKKVQQQDEKTPLQAILDKIPEDQRLSYRLDYHLSTPAVPLNPMTYINSHVNYWSNVDLVSFILNQLYAKKDCRNLKSIT